jgi:hypothetical protein
MRLARRRILWLSTALLLALVVGAWCFVPRSRVTLANFDRIHKGMSWDEVLGILDDPYPGARTNGETEEFWQNLNPCGTAVLMTGVVWHKGPDSICVQFDNSKVVHKEIHLATPWETLIWYAKHGAEKIGVTWD